MPQFAGNINKVGLAEVLRLLTGTKQTGQLVLKQGPDDGAIAMDQGILVHAETGPDNGMPAIFQIILWRDARFEFVEAPLEAKKSRELAGFETKVIIDGIARKIDELAALEQAVPSLDSVLLYMGSEALGDLKATPSELALLIMADGQRTVQQIAELGGVSPTEVARAFARFREVGALELVSEVVPANPEPPPLTVEPPPIPPSPEEPRYWRGQRIN